MDITIFVVAAAVMAVLTRTPVTAPTVTPVATGSAATESFVTHVAAAAKQSVKANL